MTPQMSLKADRCVDHGKVVAWLRLWTRPFHRSSWSFVLLRAGRGCRVASSGRDGRRGYSDACYAHPPLWLLFAGSVLGGLGVL